MSIVERKRPVVEQLGERVALVARSSSGAREREAALVELRVEVVPVEGVDAGVEWSQRPTRHAERTVRFLFDRLSFGGLAWLDAPPLSGCAVPPRRALALPATASAAGFKDRVLTGSVARASQARRHDRALPDRRRPVDPGHRRRPRRRRALRDARRHVPARRRALRAADRRRRPPPTINAECGGHDGDGILACYGANDQTMIVPDAQAAGSDVSVDYVIAHEYGHHIAAHRSNAPLRRARLRPEALVLLRARVLEHASTAGSPRATRAPTTSPTPARRGPRPTRG